MALKETLMKPLVTGAIGAAATYFFFDGNQMITIGGMNINAALFTFGALTASEYVGETMKNYVLPYLPQSGYAASLEGALLVPVLTGGVLTGSYLLLGISDKSSIIPLFVLGAGSSMAGDYVFNHFLSHM